MKLLLDINAKYKESEVHICSAEASAEVCELKEFLANLLDDKVTAHRDQETRNIAAYEIVRLYSENKRVYLRTMDSTFEVRERLYTFEETLRAKGFVRISNSEIVNIARITKLDMSYAGTIKMYLKNGDITFVSRRYVSRIKEVLSGEGR